MNAIFDVVLIKPTHYDDRGYPIQWRKSAMPSNTLACIYALAEDARQRHILGDAVDIRLHAFDETNDHVRPDGLISMIRGNGGRGLILLLGVQTNQFPRAVDLARPFAAAGLPVCIGGFHVSGCIAMLPEMPAEMREAQAMGISLFAGEAEARRLDGVLRDGWAGKLAPLYNYMDDLPGLEGEPPPILPAEQVHRIDGSYSCMDLGRGCPYKCSFCTIINVQGHKSRFRSADDVERIIRQSYAQGIKRFFITDDNFARNRNWEALFDRIIEVRARDRLNIGFTLQVDTQCHQIPGFIEKAAQAGVQHVFIGLENINPDNLIAARKHQNKITDYRVMLQKWQAHGVITLAGYILGFPGDTKESILRDVAIIKRELPLDIIEFFVLQPLPGSKDHQVLHAQGVWMDPDLNKYDVNHRVTHHPKMTDVEWEDAIRLAWDLYYTPEHMHTVLRRAAAAGHPRMSTLATMILAFSTAIAIEGVHPLDGGTFRRKYRDSRRSGLKRESALVFYSRYLAEKLVKNFRYWAANRGIQRSLQAVMAAPDRLTYRDAAITPAQPDEFETLDLYHATNGGEAELARRRRFETIKIHLPARKAPAGASLITAAERETSKA